MSTTRLEKDGKPSLTRLRRTRPDLELRPTRLRAIVGMGHAFSSGTLFGYFLVLAVDMLITERAPKDDELWLPVVAAAAAFVVGAIFSVTMERFGQLGLVGDKLIVTFRNLENPAVVPWDTIDQERTRRGSLLHSLFGHRRIVRIDERPLYIPRAFYSDDTFEGFLDDCEQHIRSNVS